MSFKVAILCLVFAISAVLAQKPLPCTTPPQWEARYFSYDEFQDDQIKARLSYDAIYRRERIIEEYTLGTDDEFYDVLYLHNQQIEYRFSFKTKQCVQQPITRRWRDFGIPANATNIGESYIGSGAIPDANVLVTIWRDQFVDEKGNQINYMGTWTYSACLPVSVEYFSGPAKINTHTRFYDITPGISNPNVFIPRPECLSV